MEKLTRRTVLGCSIGGLALGVMAPGSAATTASGTLVVAISTNPATFDPANQGSHDAMVVSQLVFENLVETGLDGINRPALARAMPTISPDGLVYTFDLRDDVTFHDARRLTAEDVKYSYDWVRDPANKALRRPIWAVIDKVEVTGPLQVRFTLSRPHRPLLDNMTKYMGIFPAGSREAFDADHFRLSPTGVGTGPGMFVSFRSNDVVELKRNPSYWRRDLPAWNTLQIRVIPEDAARIAALLAGDVQIVGAPPARDYTRLHDTAAIKGGSRPALGSAMLMLHNTSKPPFDDVNLRRAVSCAIDRRVIADRLCAGLMEPSAVPAPASAAWFDQAASDALSFNLDKAKSYLAASRYAKGASFELMYSAQPYLLDTKDIAVFIQSRLAAIGLTATLLPVEAAQLIGQVAVGNVTSALMLVVGPNDPTFLVQSIYGPGQVFSRGSAYDSPELNGLLLQASAAQGEALDPVLRRIQQHFADTAPGAWLGTPKAFNLWRADVTGFEVNSGLTLRPAGARAI